MADMAAISAALTSVKAAMELAKLLRGADLSLEKAEGKMKLAELMEALADARTELAQVQDLALEQERRIKELEQAAETRGRVKYQAPYYWLLEGERKDGPFCQQCYDKLGRLIRLQDLEDGVWGCMTCKNNYSRRGYRPRQDVVDDMEF